MFQHGIPHASALHGWRKSSYSSPERDSCVEVIDGRPGAVPVRDSKDPHGPALLLRHHAWSAFISSLKRGYLTT
ncbi:DUF397 domain-containing protein [Streptomyces sp. NPDC097619]|uniref:DUF397 domain-containing protein n=1 Tax=Streptomyces sp. NPDC097619 TaxID=3157228 RepID=UPI00332BBB9B